MTVEWKVYYIPDLMPGTGNTNMNEDTAPNLKSSCPGGSEIYSNTKWKKCDSSRVEGMCAMSGGQLWWGREYVRRVTEDKRLQISEENSSLSP